MGMGGQPGSVSLTSTALRTRHQARKD